MDRFHTETFSLDGESVSLVLAEPNWSKGVAIRYHMETLVKTGVTGIEARMPTLANPLLSMSWKAWFNESDSAEIRNLIRTLDGRRVAAPIWVDAVESGSWAGIRHVSQINAGWNAGFSGVNITQDGSKPTGDFCAPVLVGILKNPEFSLLSDLSLETQFYLEEDSPWASRIQIQSASIPSSFTFEPNWQGSPKEVTSDFLEPVYFPGRERGQQGSGLTLLAQKAKFLLEGAALGAFLGFFVQQKGSAYKFDATVFPRAGSALGQTP